MTLVTSCLADASAVSLAVGPHGKVGPADPSPEALRLYQTDNFLIYHDGAVDWAVQLGVQLESLADEFYRQMAGWGVQKPGQMRPQRLQWWCRSEGECGGNAGIRRFVAHYDTRMHRVEITWTPDAQDNHRFTTFGSNNSTAAFEPSGFALTGENTEGLYRRLSHEMAHQLSFDCGLQKRGVMYPLWIAEGLATNLESPDAKMQFLGANPARRTRLKRLYERERLLPFRELIAIASTRGMSRRERIELYAQLWGFFRFLAHERAAELQSHMRELAEMRGGRRTDLQLQKEMALSFGPLSDLEVAWQKWLAQL